MSAPLQAFHQVVGKNAPAPGQNVPVYCSIASDGPGVAGGGVYDPDVRDALIMAWTSFQRAGGTSLPGGAGGDTLISPVSL